MVAILIAGTLKVSILTQTYFSLHIPGDFPAPVPDLLSVAHLNLQGVAIIALLVLIVVFARRGFENFLERFSGWSGLTLATVGATLVTAAPTNSEGKSILIEFTGRSRAVMVLLAALAVTAWQGLTQVELAN